MGLGHIFTVTIPQNLKMAFETMVLLIIVFGAIIWFSRDFKTGIIMLLMAMTGVFIWFYQKQLNYTYALVILFVCIVLMALTLYFTSKTEKTGSSLV